MAHFPEPTPGGDDLPAEASQIADLFDARERQVAEREQALADARAAFRRERDADRDRLAADRADVARLKREARALHDEAARARNRTKQLAYRYARRVRQKWADVRADLETRQAALDEDRGQFSAEVARFGTARSEFYAAVAAENERLRDGWAALEGQRRRASAEWAETTDYFAKQEAALTARAADLAGREAAVAAAKGKLEKDTAGLREEAAGLEARVQHARAVVDELEQKRDQLRAELLTSLPLAEPDPAADLRVALDRAADRDLATWAADLDARDQQLAQEKAGLATLKAGLDRDAAGLADQRRVLAEQFVQLATARAQWQDAERRTVEEMEDLARGLRRREEDLDARDQWLVGADARRREDAHDLWRLRLQLEAWQSKLTAVGRRWHAERELREAEYARRVQALTHFESTVEDTFGRWDRVRAEEHDRLRAELRLWADDRGRLVEAAADFDRRSREVLTELMAHAARAMVSEELAAGAVEGAGAGRATRRLEVMRKRWERVFRKKLDEIDDRRSAAAADLARLDERYQELHRALIEAAGREAELNARAARAEASELESTGWTVEPAGRADRAAPDDLAALRDEVERMAAVLMNAGVPELPDGELPWAVEETGPEAAALLPFRQHAQAA
ncbi:MAG: smc 7 [Gemmataceae bacterium]|nr:smc 7 [Gemmataceae bacterium]